MPTVATFSVDVVPEDGQAHVLMFLNGSNIKMIGPYDSFEEAYSAATRITEKMDTAIRAVTKATHR